MHSIKRSYQKLAEEYLNYFPCVAILGPRQCGKTTLLQMMGEPWTIFDLEKRSDLQNIENDPDLFFRLNSENVAIDEAQRLPEIFPALRVAIDQQRDVTGRFILTGSSSPELVRSISESLAGRVAIIEMATFSLTEIHGLGQSDFYQAFQEPDRFLKIVEGLTPLVDIDDIHDYWFRGGYPEPWLKNDPRFQDLWMEQYVGTYLDRDISILFPSLNRQRFGQFTQMLAGLSGSVINYSEVARAVSVSQPTIRDYFGIAHGTYIWRNLPSYAKNVKKRVVKHPKGYIRDAGLLHHLLRIRDLSQLMSHPAMGFSWESLVVEQILRGLTSRGITFDSFFYRTTGGAEVDLILEGKFGLIPIEIKYRQHVSKNQLIGITGFMKEHDCPFGLVVNNDEKVRLYDYNLVGIPLACCL